MVSEFLHVATDGRRFAPPLTMAAAVDWIEEFLQNPEVCLVDPNQENVTQALRWIRQFNLGRKRILDTQLAAVLYCNGVRRLMTSNPADFCLFGVLETITP